LVGWLFGWLVVWLFGWLVGWLVGRLVGKDTTWKPHVLSKNARHKIYRSYNSPLAGGARMRCL
jgi:hypothetical protein